MHWMVRRADKGRHSNCPCVRGEGLPEPHRGVAGAWAGGFRGNTPPRPSYVRGARQSDIGGRGAAQSWWSTARSRTGDSRWWRLAVPLAFAVGVGLLSAMLIVPDASKRLPTPGTTGIAGSVASGAATLVPRRQAAASTSPSLLPIANISLWDPRADGDEHIDQIFLTQDDNPDTAWFTESFATSHFSGTRPGVGLTVDLGSTHWVNAVQLILPFAGASIQLRAADAPSGRSQDYRLIQTEENAPQNLTLRPPKTQARYWLVEIVKLPKALTGSGDEYPYKAGIAEMHFIGA